MLLLPLGEQLITNEKSTEGLKVSAPVITLNGNDIRKNILMNFQHYYFYR